ncbi:hypothetical protein GCM10007876_02780 [Litoribrevibacter albus]|uniref:Uncharacterized protein n=2 Tax=Litoribrevibacter albus TaxID=1473156 RepID=A0AA37W4L8_9GAMM|nr:hypothetical protein GCM10007876_02780 [Litoribrevibacter albus]
MVLLYTVIYLVCLQILNHLFALQWSSIIAIVVLSLFYIIQMVSYVRRRECIEMPVGPERPRMDEFPSLTLNDKNYQVMPNSVLLPSYIMLELRDEEQSEGKPGLWKKLTLNKQLMIFPDQCRREEFHTLIRIIRMSFGR